MVVTADRPEARSVDEEWQVWNYPSNNKKSTKDIDCCEPIDLPQCCYTYRVGNMYVFCDMRNNRTETIQSENYTFPCMTSHQSKFSFITVILIFGIPSISYTMFFNFWYEKGDALATIVLFIGLCLWFFTLCSFCLTKFCNPGIRPIPEEIRNEFSLEDLKSCQRRLPDHITNERGNRLKFVASHGVYVEGFDHICPWIGNIIARDNMCYFQCFLTSCTVALIFFLILLLVSLGHAGEDSE